MSSLLSKGHENQGAGQTCQLDCVKLANAIREHVSWFAEFSHTDRILNYYNPYTFDIEEYVQKNRAAQTPEFSRGEKLTIRF